MSGGHLFRFVSDLKLRGKLLMVVLPLVTIPVLVVGTLVGFIATKQAYRGITQTSKDDLEHMARFAIDLPDSHYQQFEVCQQERKKSVDRELATLVNLAYNLVESEQRQQRAGRISLADAKREARKALRSVNVGETGYLYAMTSAGELTVHVALEGRNIAGEQDESGRHFIREMCRAALASKPGEVLFIVYPWRNAALGDASARKKVVAYRYFREWDWIVAAGGYLEETYEDVAFEQRLHHVSVLRDFAPDLPTVPVDPDQMRQVAINLILNAGAALAAGGTITVGTRASAAGFVDIVIRDEGAGIAPENLEKIFEPFFTTKSRGTGLGLAITRRIVEQHHGRITVASEVGQGTTVTVCLPIEREEQ